MKVVNILHTIISSQELCLKKKKKLLLPLQATPHFPDTGTTSFLQLSSQNVTILVQTCWKDEVDDVSAVPLELQECARETKVFRAIKCT